MGSGHRAGHGNGSPVPEITGRTATAAVQTAVLSGEGHGSVRPAAFRPDWRIPAPSMLPWRWGQMKTREFGELEAAIMDALWTADRALAVREIRETMTYRRDVAYTTVMTVANILFNKGVLHREKVGRAWRYQ